MKTTTAIITALLALTMTVAATSCSSSNSNTTADGTSIPATTTTTTVERPTRLVDELISTGHGHMHIRCVGSGPTTVLLIAGWDDAGDHWGEIEPALTRQARVCSYSRFGTGSSDAPATMQTFETQAADLHALLEAAGEQGPYVVLGHSFGGAEAVTFTSDYSNEVKGLMLLDASPVTWPDTVCSVTAYAPVCDLMHDPANDGEQLDVVPAFEAVARITSLGDLPMTVMTAAHRIDPTLPQRQLDRLDAAWARGVDQWAALSNSSRTVTVEHTGHHIEIDQPAAVTTELLKLLP